MLICICFSHTNKQKIIIADILYYYHYVSAERMAVFQMTNLFTRRPEKLIIIIIEYTTVIFW